MPPKMRAVVYRVTDVTLGLSIATTMSNSVQLQLGHTRIPRVVYRGQNAIPFVGIPVFSECVRGCGHAIGPQVTLIVF